MGAQVIAKDELFQFTKARQFQKHVFKNIVEAPLNVLFCQRAGKSGIDERVVPEIVNDDSLTERRLVMKAGAFITMATRANFEIKGAVDSTEEKGEKKENEKP